MAGDGRDKPVIVARRDRQKEHAIPGPPEGFTPPEPNPEVEPAKKSRGGIAAPGAPKTGKKTKKIRGIKPSRRIQAAVRADLWRDLELLFEDVISREEWLRTADPAQANAVLRQLRDKWRELYSPKADELAKRWIGDISREGKERFADDMARALGVNFTAIFDDQVVHTAATAGAVEASNLIKSIPDEYFGQIERAVLTHYQQIPLPEGRSLIEEIMHISGVSKEKAALIARDQTSKVHSAIVKARNEEVGIETYIWRTSEDIRVVGTPGGLYPEGNRVHGNHYVRNGKRYWWNKPPLDGHPGYAIRCRCIADPEIDVAKLKYV